MNTTEIAARRREISAEANDLVIKSISNSEKSARLDALSAELKRLDIEAETTAKAHHYADVFPGDTDETKGGKKTSTGFAPLQFAADQTAALFKAAGDGIGITVKALPTVTGTLDPATHTAAVLPPTLVRREPTRVLDLIPSTPMAAGVIEYYAAVASGTGAGPTAEGAAKPDAQLAFTKTTLSATKLAVYSSATEEALEDFGAFQQYLQAELIAQIIDAENRALLTGTATGASTFNGFMTATGVQTIAATGAYAGFTTLDLLGAGMDNLRAGGRYTEATGIVLNPTTWGALRRAKATGSGEYIVGDPTSASNLSLWGIPVVLTTQIPANRALVADFTQAATAYVRAGLTVRSNANGSGFRNNVTEFVAEERIALAITAPSAVCIATLA